jgi:capsular exopolysaccharide synthesis family protein
LLKRQSETGVSASLRGLRTSNIKLVDRAEVPLFPSSPNKKKNLLLGFIVGLMGGLGLAFLLDYLDNSVKNSEDVEKYAKLPTWGIVPTFDPDGFRKGYGYGYGYGHRKKGTEGAVKGKAGGAEAKGKDDALPRLKFIELISYFAPKSSFAESYRSIRTALLLSSPETQLKILVVTSPLPIEGKTATICNLAVTLAQMNKRVLILDADLRKPRQHKIFGIKNLNGLTNYLASRLELKELIKPTYIPSLFLVNAGPVPPNPSELLGSDKMASFLDMMRKYFDYVLIDTPPLLAVTDSMIIPKTDGVVLIVWAGRTSREALMRAREELGLMKIKTLGVILNHLDISKHDYYYRHHYYHYYSDQLDEKSH